MTARSIDADRFWAMVDRTDECWAWTGYLTPLGYGSYRGWWVHRLAYDLSVGPIPDGLELDHLCRNRRCVNPDHLEPVTHRVNVLRGVSPPSENARKTACPRGHPYDHIHVKRGKRQRRCSICERDDWGRERQRVKAAPTELKTHGYGGYTRGCRCDVCRTECSVYRRQWRRKRAA